MKDLENLTQRELESYFKTLREVGGDDRHSNVENAGACVRTLIKLGWIDSMDVDNAKPKEIMRIYVDTLQGINKALLPIPKN